MQIIYSPDQWWANGLTGGSQCIVKMCLDSFQTDPCFLKKVSICLLCQYKDETTNYWTVFREPRLCVTDCVSGLEL